MKKIGIIVCDHFDDAEFFMMKCYLFFHSATSS